MRLLFIILTISCLIEHGFAQQRKYSTFYEQRASLFSALPIESDDIIFLGNSITNGGEWHELFQNPKIKNRGISGDIAEGVYNRLDDIVQGKPAKIFLMIGINDIAKGSSSKHIVLEVEKIIHKIKKETPETKLYLQSILPVNPDFGLFLNHMKPDSILKINHAIRRISKKHQLVYIDLYSEFILAGTNKLSPKYTNDGLHLLGEGYLLWSKILQPYLNN